MEISLKAKQPTLEDIKYKEHFMQTVAALKFISKMELPNEEILESLKSKKWLEFNEKMEREEGRKRKKTMIFDLDETLIHVAKKTRGCEFKIPVTMKDGKVVKVS